MDLLILVRSDITNLIIVTALLIFSLFWRKKGAHAKDSFIILVIATLGHVAFGLITEITVNTSSPRGLNYICHVLYYGFALMFVAEYYRYVLSLFLPRKVLTIHMTYAYTICGLSLISIPAFGLEFIEGEHTNYSSGPGVTVCFASSFLIFIAASVIFILHSKRIEKSTIAAILPITLVALVFGYVQYTNEEFLFTGSAMTLITLTIFFIIENPAKDIQERAFIDYSTGLYNRNCYEKDSAQFEKEFLYRPFAIAVFDLNHLKYVNDHFGHREGDTMIILTADILQSELRGAKKIYRIGGDEFLAVYTDAHVLEVENQIAAVHEKCDALCDYTAIPLQIAGGFSQRKEGEALAALQERADSEMYKNKALLKAEKPLKSA